jgi:hypothetical protein
VGYGQYSHDAHVAMTNARSASGREVFTNRTCHPHMDPKGVRLRESRDSETHPTSIGIVFALDVSGSMGEIPKLLASATLPAFMKALLDAGVADPQVLFMAVGYAGGDRAPLQVGQFESTESLMDQWLTNMWLEGGGGGGNESYELAMYFAARHTAMDCVEKRGRRGYFFVTGDEPPNPVVSRTQVDAIIGDELADDVPIGRVVDELQRTFEPFYLIPDQARGANVGRAWRDVLGSRVIVMDSPDDTSAVAAGAVALLEGAAPSLDALVDRLERAGFDRPRLRSMAKALAPFAATIDRDGLPRPPLTKARPSSGGPSGMKR